RDRVFDRAAFVDRIGMYRHLHIIVVGHCKAGIDRRWRRAPILMQLQAARTRQYLLLHAVGLGGIAAAGEDEVDGNGVGRLHHQFQIGRVRGACGRKGPRRRPRAAADERGDAARHRRIGLCGADIVEVRVDTASGQDEAFTCDHLSVDADDQVRVDARHDVRVAGLADAGDLAVLDADVSFHDAGVVDDQSIGDHAIERPRRVNAGRLTHAVADDLAGAENALVAVDGVILFHLRYQARVAKLNLVARGWSE